MPLRGHRLRFCDERSSVSVDCPRVPVLLLPGARRSLYVGSQRVCSLHRLGRGSPQPVPLRPRNHRPARVQHLRRLHRSRHAVAGTSPRGNQPQHAPFAVRCSAGEPGVLRGRVGRRAPAKARRIVDTGRGRHLVGGAPAERPNGPVPQGGKPSDCQQKTGLRQGGIEPPTRGLEGRCSIQLSYWRVRVTRCHGARRDVHPLKRHRGEQI